MRMMRYLSAHPGFLRISEIFRVSGLGFRVYLSDIPLLCGATQCQLQRLDLLSAAEPQKNLKK